MREMFTFKSKTQDLKAFGPNGGKTIEVFDVVIRSKQRLQCFHLKSGQDLLVLNDYIPKMETLFKVKSTNPLELNAESEGGSG